MSDVFMDKFIADLVKGASRSEGFVRGGSVGVEVSRDHRGREEKLAGLGGGLGGAFGPLGAAIGGGAQDDSVRSAIGGGVGSMLGAPTGALAGGLGGAGIGALIARIADKDPAAGAALGAALGIPIGGLGGSMLGGHVGQNMSRPEDKQASITQSAYVDGAAAAAEHFGLEKNAFLGALAGLAGSALGGVGLRAGANALAQRGAGSMLGRVGQGVMNFAAKGPIHGALVETAGSMAGGALANKLVGQ